MVTFLFRFVKIKEFRVQSDKFARPSAAESVEFTFEFGLGKVFHLYLQVSFHDV